MTQVTAKMVQELRERTGVGMMECKKALVAANGEIDLAIEALRKAGQATAVKKGGRVAAEGLVAGLSSADNSKVELVEVNCETDFVARENSFKQFCRQVAACALEQNVSDVDGLLQASVDGKTIEATRLELVAQLGENVVVRRAVCVQAPAGGTVALYLHGGSDGAARIATAVALNVDNLGLARDIAMHIAGMKPEFLAEADVPVERVEKEKEILLAQAQEQDSSKPREILEKIIVGRMGKFLKEITLVNQPFVKDPDQTVGQLLAKAKAEVTTYVRFEVGEGIEKKVTDFVGEVMAQVKG